MMGGGSVTHVSAHVLMFCSVMQKVTLGGSLTIAPTPCNGVLSAVVEVSNPNGETIVATDVIEVRLRSEVLFSKALCRRVDRPSHPELSAEVLNDNNDAAKTKQNIPTIWVAHCSRGLRGHDSI